MAFVPGSGLGFRDGISNVFVLDLVPVNGATTTAITSASTGAGSTPGVASRGAATAAEEQQQDGVSEKLVLSHTAHSTSVGSGVPLHFVRSDRRVRPLALEKEWARILLLLCCDTRIHRQQHV